VDQDEFNDFVRRKPFRPYRMTLSDGRTYDLGHPDKAAVGFGSVVVMLPAGRKVLVSLMHIVQLEFLEVEASSQSKEGNGTT
jgi:hypothetical protein